MNNKNKEKIEMWTKKMEALEQEYKDTMVQRGEAAAMGDLRENAAYQMLTEQGEVLSARINDIRKVLKELEKSGEEK